MKSGERSKNMNIVLLSGGSGRRLWPLSNETRSKQFLKLLKTEEGKYESMVQRVYRQIRQVYPESNIAVATSLNQVDSIKSQLGDSVDIVIEPERRDTFPAIVLASAHLFYNKKLSSNESMIVIPIDSYVDIEYFNTLKEIRNAVDEDLADIVLMGIKPTYPSEKYGYMLLNKDSITKDAKTYKVKRFVEKPRVLKATELIAEGAVWNGGIFGFKISYIMEMVGTYVKARNFDELRNNYNKLKKISFDYEVVEKAKRVAMVLYTGKWKDLGTWNTLSEEMKEPYMGCVNVGEGTCETNIINELPIPIVALGAKNLIIVASPDGILVSDKEKSSYLKSYVDSINQRPMYGERVWGHYNVLDYKNYVGGMKSLTRQLYIKEGSSLGYHSHMHIDEIWTILDGVGSLTIEGSSRIVQCGDVVNIHKGQIHNIKAVTDMSIIEVQLGNELDMEDMAYHNEEKKEA
ncbi:MAG: mannose-phosphate guanylyltransferase [Anaerocolumna sp.]|jgi:mannose-1-phosphate guanylyltransferase|nr:mannose-phosphate guanylyltransferase [Anaerocolumna sp.]